MGESFEVDNYYVSIPGVRDTDAMIAVTGTNGLGAGSTVFFWFVSSGLAPAVLSAGGGEVYLPIERLASMVDLLRNESPIWCAYDWDAGHTDGSARLATSAEPPGEGE